MQFSHVWRTIHPASVILPCRYDACHVQMNEFSTTTRNLIVPQDSKGSKIHVAHHHEWYLA